MEFIKKLHKDVVDIFTRFYRCTKREPRFIQIYTENDGSSYSGTGSLFDRCISPNFLDSLIGLLYLLTVCVLLYT